MLNIYEGTNVVVCNPNFDSAENRCGKTHVAESFSRCSKLTKNETIPTERSGTHIGNVRMCFPNFITFGCVLLCMIDIVTTTEK